MASSPQLLQLQPQLLDLALLIQDDADQFLSTVVCQILHITEWTTFPLLARPFKISNGNLSRNRQNSRNTTALINWVWLLYDDG